MNKELQSIPQYQKFKVKRKSDGKEYRAMRESYENIFVFAPGRSRRGYRMSAEFFEEQYEIIPLPDPEKAWKRKVNGIVKRLEKSGLWPEILEQFRNLQKMSYADRETIKAIMRELPYDATRTKEEYEAIFGKFIAKYPFLFYGDGSVRSDYLYGLSDGKTKSMYFGPYRTKYAKERIGLALREKLKWTETARTSYDVSFEYDPEESKAWYSEEYKNCGNGHYYLALDESCALFCEDD